MSDIACITDDCPEQGIPKSSGGFDPAEIVCGECGGPVEPVGADE